MIMFAVAPLIVYGIWIGGAAVIGGIASLFAWKARRWFKKDPNKDMVIFMGPKEGGKTELLAALKGNNFDPKRQGTGFRTNFECGFKDFVACDSGGDAKIIKVYTDKIVEYVKEKQPNFVLVVLVTNVQDISWSGLPPPDGKSSLGQIDLLAEYLDFFTTSCEEECRTNKIKTMLGENCFTKRYDNGHWAYAVIGTHLAKMDKATVTGGLTNLTRHLDQYRRKMCFAGTGVFELSEKKMRNSAVSYIEELLKRLHAS